MFIKFAEISGDLLLLATTLNNPLNCRAEVFASPSIFKAAPRKYGDGAFLFAIRHLKIYVL